MQDVSVITKARLSRYQRRGEMESKAIDRYIWNIQLSEALYPALALFEIAFRNRMDQAICNQIDPLWLDENWQKWPVKAPFERMKILDAKKKIQQRHRGQTRGHLVAELTLGFWVGLLNKPYKPLLWQKQGMIEAVFPNFTGKALDRIPLINPPLQTIRLLRNRISHHEPIFDWPGGLDKVYTNLENAVSWISKDTHITLQKISRFPAIWVAKI
jgi:hypothetical protein